MSHLFHFHPVPLPHQPNPSVFNIQKLDSTPNILQEIETETCNERTVNSDKSLKFKSCERCRKYKRKCDRKSPKCSQCEAASRNLTDSGKSIPCLYTYRPKKINSQKTSINKPDNISSMKSKKSVIQNRGIDSFSNIINIPNQDLLGKPMSFIPTPSIPLESISSDLLARSDNYHFNNSDIGHDFIVSTSAASKCLSSTLPSFDSIPLDLNISSKHSTSPSLDSDSIAFAFPKNTSVIELDSYSASIPFELPTFTISIDDS